MAVLFKNYRYLSIVDTHSYDLDDVLPMAKAIAGAFNLTHRVIPGTIQYLRDLLTGPWDGERFVRLPPYSRIGEASADKRSSMARC
jgi:hypothetical protein